MTNAPLDTKSRDGIQACLDSNRRDLNEIDRRWFRLRDEAEWLANWATREIRVPNERAQAFLRAIDDCRGELFHDVEAEIQADIERDEGLLR